MTHCQYIFLGVIRILCNLRWKNSIKLGYFYQLFSLSQQRFWLAEKLRSHVTITLRDKSRYDLIVEMSQSFVGDHVWST